jgi:hypothetical protein
MAEGIIAGALLGVCAGSCALAIAWRWLEGRRRRLAAARAFAQLDEDERRFKRRLERGAGGDGAFSDSDLDALGGVNIGLDDEDLELSAREIEQLQQLEAELARRARGVGVDAAVGVAGGEGSSLQGSAKLAPQRASTSSRSAAAGDASAHRAQRSASPAAFSDGGDEQDGDKSPSDAPAARLGREQVLADREPAALVVGTASKSKGKGSRASREKDALPVAPTPAAPVAPGRKAAAPRKV